MTNSLILAIRFIFLYMIVTLVIPGVNGTEHVWTLIQYVVSYPAEYMFYFFRDMSEVLATSDWSNNNPLQDFFYLFAWAGLMFLALAVPVVYVFLWITLVYLSTPLNNMQWDTSPESKNTAHLLAGRTTIQDTFDAEVQANEIARALKS